MNFPALKGSYQVGTETFHWIDSSRPETFTDDQNDHRELMIQVWYPTKATVDTHKRQPYADNPEEQAKAFESYVRIPVDQSLPLFTSTTHSFIQALIAASKDPYPVLLFSHGFGMRNDSYRFIVEQLASQGYIVISVQHTYTSFLTTFPTGKTAPLKISDADSLSYLDQLITTVWVKDIQFVLDHLEQLAKESNNPIWKQLDLQRIGMLGHSYGGATTAQVMLVDNRIKAGINMDGGLYGKVIPDTGIPGPFLIMSAAIDGIDNLENIDPKQLAEQQGIDEEKVTEMISHSISRHKKAVRHCYSLSFVYAAHVTFSDIPFTLAAAASTDASNLTSFSRIHEIVNEYTLDFFDHFLKSEPTKLLIENSNKYEDVTLKIGEKAKTKSEAV